MRFYIAWATMLVGTFVTLQLGMAGYVTWAAVCAIGAIGGLVVCFTEIRRASGVGCACRQKNQVNAARILMERKSEGK